MKDLERPPRRGLRAPARIALLYLVASLVWIVVTDAMVEGLGIDVPSAQTLRSALLVLLSAVLIGWLLRREDQRQASLRRRFEAIAEQETVGIFIARGPDLVYINPMLSRILGHPREAFRGGRGRDFLDAVQAGQVVASGTRGEEDEAGPYRRVLATRADGTTTPLHVFERPVDLEEGAARIGIVLDAAPLETLESRLRQTAKLEALGQVTGSVAHDFNNLLTGVIGQLDLALLDLPMDDPVRRGLVVARDTARRAAVLTGQLLAFSRSRVSRSQAIDVNMAIRELGGLLESLSGSTIEIRQELEEPLLPIQLGPGSFDQLLVNLFVNAKQAMQGGGGEITVRTRGVDRDGRRWVAIEVEDSGMGIPAPVLERMFEPFFTTKKHGTGLGLTTVRSIVDRGGGSLEVESEPGRGTTMRSLFPATQETPVARTKVEPADVDRSRQARTVLVVDDEPAVRRVIAAALRRRGYQVLEAADGKAALKQFLAEAVDLVICDVVLPGQSGVEVVKELVRLRPELKVLLITGYTPRDLVEHEASLSEFSFLEKPFSLEDLMASVERLRREADGAA